MNSHSARARLSICIALLNSAAALSSADEPPGTGREPVGAAKSPVRTQRFIERELEMDSLCAAAAATVEQPASIRRSLPTVRSRPRSRPLYVLDLQGCPINDACCQSIAEISELQELQLICTHITYAGLKPLCRLRNLQWLDLRGTRITDDGIACLAELPNLQMLDIRGTAVTASGVGYLQSRRPNLEVLRDRHKAPADVDRSLASAE